MGETHLSLRFGAVCLRILVEANVAMERASFCGINIFVLASLLQASAPPNKLTLMRAHRKGQAVVRFRFSFNLIL